MAHRTRGLVDEEDQMCRARVRSRALMTASKGTIATSALSEGILM